MNYDVFSNFYVEDSKKGVGKCNALFTLFRYLIACENVLLLKTDTANRNVWKAHRPECPVHENTIPGLQIGQSEFRRSQVCTGRVGWEMYIPAIPP
jgi:hypothetical protein